MSTTIEARVRDVVTRLYDIDALKFGNFKMKIGVDSPVYFDLRVIISYPKLLKEVSNLMWEFANEDLNSDHICGVPYTALPLASIISVNTNIPMLIRRKEAKSYGTKKLIEGKFKKGDTCTIIEDVVTSGSSILDTYKDLNGEGLIVKQAIVIVDREQGGFNNLAQYGMKMKSLCTLSQMMDILYAAGKVDDRTAQSVKQYIADTQIPLPDYVSSPTSDVKDLKVDRLRMPYSERGALAKNAVAAKLFSIMEAKKSNLCLSADLPKAGDVLSLVREVASHICLLKTHCDIIQDFSEDFVNQLKALAKEYNFLIMEDRKFADIGHVVSLQYFEGMYNIVSWADFVTVHATPGPGIISGLKSKVANEERGCFVVVEMSSAGNLMSEQYSKAAMELCAGNEDFVGGVVCQTAATVTSPGLVQLTPGVSLDIGAGSDGLGQRYTTPEDAVLVRGADVAVAGRAVTKATDPKGAAAELQARLWAAYQSRLAKA